MWCRSHLNCCFSVSSLFYKFQRYSWMCIISFTVDAQVLHGFLVVMVSLSLLMLMEICMFMTRLDCTFIGTLEYHCVFFEFLLMLIFKNELDSRDIFFRQKMVLLILPSPWSRTKHSSLFHMPSLIRYAIQCFAKINSICIWIMWVYYLQLNHPYHWSNKHAFLLL